MSTWPNYDYGKIDYLTTVPRYTTLEDVKARLGIAATDVTRDPEITEAIVAAEYAIDAALGRSFPDGPGDATADPVLEPGPIDGIPVSVKQAALTTAVAMWKEPDSPFGTAGADEMFMGAIDVSDVARRIVDRSAGLRGLKVADGFGVA